MSERAGSDDSKTVLVVDDEPDVADLYAAYLEREYVVRQSYDGREVLEDIDEDVDLVLLDRRMPGFSGDDVLAEIRDEGYDCRVVMVTAVDPDFDVLELAIDGYLIKPVHGDDLLDTVADQFERAEYDPVVDEYLKLRDKLELIEAEKIDRELHRDDRYTDLASEAESMRERHRDVLAAHDAVDLPE